MYFLNLFLDFRRSKNRTQTKLIHLPVSFWRCIHYLQGLLNLNKKTGPSSLKLNKLFDKKKASTSVTTSLQILQDSRSQGHAALRRPERSERPRGVIFGFSKPCREGRTANNAKKIQNTQKHRGPKVLYVYLYKWFLLGQNSCFYWGKVWQVKWLGTWKVSQTCHGKQVRFGVGKPLGLANLPENARNFGWNFGQLQGLPCKSWYLKGLCFKWCQMFSWLSLAFSKISKTTIGWDLAKYIEFYHVFSWVMYCCLYPSGPIRCDNIELATQQWTGYSPAAAPISLLPAPSAVGSQGSQTKKNVKFRKTEKPGLCFCFRIFWRCFFLLLFKHKIPMFPADLSKLGLRALPSTAENCWNVRRIKCQCLEEVGAGLEPSCWVGSWME